MAVRALPMAWMVETIAVRARSNDLGGQPLGGVDDALDSRFGRLDGFRDRLLDAEQVARANVDGQVKPQREHQCKRYGAARLAYRCR